MPGAKKTEGRWEKFTLTARYRNKALTAPPGYDNSTAVTAAQQLPAQALAAQKLRVQDRQCMQIARKPFTQIFMIAFMCWITGTSMHIFSIMQLVMVFTNAINAIVRTPEAFKPVGHPNPTKYVANPVSLMLTIVRH